MDNNLYQPEHADDTVRFDFSYGPEPSGDSPYGSDPFAGPPADIGPSGDDSLPGGYQLPEDGAPAPEHKKKSSGNKGGKKIIIAVVAIIVVAALAAGGVFIAKNVAAKNQEAADEVIEMIERLEGDTITLDSEEQINDISDSYDNLTDSQKKLVDNYDILEEAIDNLEAAKEKAADDQAAADEVSEMIDELSGKKIDADDEFELVHIKNLYDDLTKEQQELVTNYGILDNALKNLRLSKDQEAADKVINAINDVDPDYLGTSYTQLDRISSQYEELTDNQKLLVTNYDKLSEYRNIVKNNIYRKNKIYNGNALASNFSGYTGKWRDFGAHKNKYQGMIETAVKNANCLRTYFVCDPNPNYLDMYVSRFTRDTSGYSIGRCYIEFAGTSKSDGTYSILSGEVVIKSDGTVYYTVTSFY